MIVSRERFYLLLQKIWDFRFWKWYFCWYCKNVYKREDRQNVKNITKSIFFKLRNNKPLKLHSKMHITLAKIHSSLKHVKNDMVVPFIFMHPSTKSSYKDSDELQHKLSGLNSYIRTYSFDYIQKCIIVGLIFTWLSCGFLQKKNRWSW